MIKLLLALFTFGFLNSICFGNQHYLDIEIENPKIVSSLLKTFEIVSEKFVSGTDTLYYGNSTRFMDSDEFESLKTVNYFNSKFRIWFDTENSIDKLTITSISRTYEVDTNRLPKYMRKKGFVVAGISLSGMQMKSYLSTTEMNEVVQICFSDSSQNIYHNTAKLIDSSEVFFIRKTLGENWSEERDYYIWWKASSKNNSMRPADWLDLLSGSCPQNKSLHFQSRLAIDSSNSQYKITFEPILIGISFYDRCEKIETDIYWTKADSFYSSVGSPITAERLYYLSLEQRILNRFWNP